MLMNVSIKYYFFRLKQKNNTIRVREKIGKGLSINIDRNIIKEPTLNKFPNQEI